MKTVSVITPFYKGNEHMQGLFRSIQENALTCQPHDIQVELVLVNDSPGVEMKIPQGQWDFQLTTLENAQNSGIHASRIHGLEVARGEYILMLDQDDLLEPDGILSNMETLGEVDAVLGNGYMKYPDRQEIIYRNRLYQSWINRLPVLLAYGDTVMSPGQCIIRKEAFPKGWLERPLKINGADDELLWVMMLLEGRRFAINPKVVYWHMDTGHNTSYDFRQMANSALEGCDTLREYTSITPAQMRTFVRRRKIKAARYKASRGKKLLLALKNPDLSIMIILVKLVKSWKGY